MAKLYYFFLAQYQFGNNPRMPLRFSTGRKKLEKFIVKFFYVENRFSYQEKNFLIEKQCNTRQTGEINSLIC